MDIKISDIKNEVGVNKTVMKNANNCGATNLIVASPVVALIKTDDSVPGALGTIDYKAIARKALSTASDAVTEMDLYLAVFDSNDNAFNSISTLHQHGPTDTLHFGFVLAINPQKKLRFRVNGWWSDKFNIMNLQKWVNGSYITVATTA